MGQMGAPLPPRKVSFGPLSHIATSASSWWVNPPPDPGRACPWQRLPGCGRVEGHVQLLGRDALQRAPCVRDYCRTLGWVRVGANMEGPH